MTRGMNINTISSEELDKCLEYSDITKISITDYGTFIRALVYTMRKELPVEVLDNSNNSILKINIQGFTLNYVVGEEGVSDSLTLNYVLVGEEKQQSMSFKIIGKNNVIKDIKSSTRTFYRYYINPDKSTGYRFTFNRRISKD